MKTCIAIAFCLFSASSLAGINSESENNNSESRADGPIEPSATVTGSLSTRRDVDWFYFDLLTSGSIDISLDHHSGRDFDWDLYAETGPAVASGASSRIPETGSYAATSAGRYFLKLSSYSGSGNYWLDVSYDSAGGGGSDPRPSKPSNLQNWISGDAEDAGVEPVGGPAMLLMGGNFDIDEAFVNRAYPVLNGGDVVVLRTSGSNGYNDYLYNLVSGSLKPNSVETLLVDTVSKANSDYVEWVVRNAELIYFAGGDQSEYLNAWKGTRLESAVRSAYGRGAVVGGISAGLAIQGEHVYDPDGVTAVISSEVLANPYHPNVMFSHDFLQLPLMQGFITDTHFQQRDRMGRLLGFMARLRQDGLTQQVIGLGIDEDSALFIDKNGMATADGDSAVYVIEESGSTSRDQVQPGQPLIYSNLRRTKLVAGQWFNFANSSHNGSAVNLSVDGRLSTPFSPASPY